MIFEGNDPNASVHYWDNFYRNMTDGMLQSLKGAPIISMIEIKIIGGLLILVLNEALYINSRKILLNKVDNLQTDW